MVENAVDVGYSAGLVIEGGFSTVISEISARQRLERRSPLRHAPIKQKRVEATSEEHTC
jgi:hypothetical protein